MKYKIFSGKEPIYLQIYSQIKRDIISLAYPYGARLPSKRTLSEETGASVISVEHAYALLSDEGYIESRERSGYFVIYKSVDFISHSEPRERLTKKIPRTPDTHKYFPFSLMAKTMRRIILDYGDTLLQKSENKGSLILREAICAYLRRTVDIEADESQVIIGAGAEYLYSLTLQLLGKDRTYALENPSYGKIQKVYSSHGVKTELLTLGENGIKSHELSKSSATVLHTTPYNSYPSLVTASAGKRREYLDWAKKRGAYIIEDNYDSELTVSKKHEETLFSMSTDSNVIYINTFSKTVSPSIRLGYMILPKSLVPAFDKHLGFLSCTVPVFEQYLIAELIKNGDFERHINRVRRERRKNQSGYIK